MALTVAGSIHKKERWESWNKESYRSLEKAGPKNQSEINLFSQFFLLSISQPLRLFACFIATSHCAWRVVLLSTSEKGVVMQKDCTACL